MRNVSRQEIQSREYDFPYHYLACVLDNNFKSYRSWSWSLSYVTALKLVTEKIREIGSKSHIDVGCGDGALIAHIHHELSDLSLCGVDYDARAIAYARAFSPELDFRSGDITQMSWPKKYQTASLIEVLEHIPIEQLPNFVRSVADMLEARGKLIVTVPSTNKAVDSKHEQHFTQESIVRTLEPYFQVTNEIFGFERISTWRKWLQRICNVRGFFIGVSLLNKYLLRQEMNFRASDGDNYGRIFLVAEKN